VSVGSTPSCASADRFPGATEIHPGNYVFFDRQQVAVGGCQQSDVAVTVLARVIGHYAGHALCDAGSLAVSKDCAPQDSAFGAVAHAQHPLLLQSVSQEVGKLVVCPCTNRCVHANHLAACPRRGHRPRLSC
jgi:D-serine deaminase-like pyridoxal phosphate-dependent protein